MGGCQNGSLLGYPKYLVPFIIIGIQKGTIILTTTHIRGNIPNHGLAGFVGRGGDPEQGRFHRLAASLFLGFRV